MGKKKEELKRREAELRAELARREAKKAKKAGKRAIDEVEAPPPNKAKKGKKAKAEKPAEPTPAELRRAKSPSRKTEVANAAAKVLADENAAPEARVMAETAADAASEATHEETDADIKARIKEKRAEHEKLAGNPSTSTVEGLDAIADPTPEKVAKARAAVAAAKEAVAAVAEVVETDRGREFVVGEKTVTGTDDAADATVHEFAQPSEAPTRWEDDTNGNGQYKVARPEDGKVVGYTRVTTYIDTNEDKTTLTKWKMRMLLEGVAVNDTPDEKGTYRADPVVAVVRDLIHNRDLAIAKARKADRKGKLARGQLATITDGAWSDFKKKLNVLAEELLDVGGANEKRQKGTDIHALTEVYDREGLSAVSDMLNDGVITPADYADIEAYARATEAAGIKLIDIERVVVIDDIKVAGRLDRTGFVKLPGEVRARRRVIDIKTGNIELGAGKIAQQLALYARGKGYDPETHEREDLKLDRATGILIHLPAGSGECHVYPVDLTTGARGNVIAGNVRAYRNEGRRAIDTKTDLATITPHTEED